MLSVKNKFLIMLLIVLFSVSVVSAVDNNSSVDNIQMSSVYIQNNQQDASHNDYNVSANDKSVNEKNISKNNDNDKLSINYTINNDTGVVTFTEYRKMIASYEDGGYIYLEGMYLDSGRIQYIDEPFQVNITNVMSDGTFNVQYMVFADVDTVSEEKTFTINDYKSKTPITLKNEITLEDNLYHITSTVINRETGEVVRDNATIGYYGVLSGLYHWGTVNVENGVASITHDKRYDHYGWYYEYYPIITMSSV